MDLGLRSAQLGARYTIKARGNNWKTGEKK